MSSGQDRPDAMRDEEDRSGRGAGAVRWDWLIFPALSLATLSLVLVTLKLVSYHIVHREGNLQSCMVVSDPTTGWRGIPRSACSFRGIEHELVRYSFNRCGDYTTLDCEGKTPGVYRIVLVGSSYGFGWGVQKDQSFASILPKELSARTGRRVELYNESMVASSTGATARRVEDALAAKPDLILWTLSPQDIAYDSFVSPAQTKRSNERDDDKPVMERPSLLADAKGMFAAVSPLEYLRGRWNNSSFGVVLQHYLYQSRTLYVKLYLMSGDRAGFLETRYSPAWEDRLRQFDQHVAGAAASAKTAGVPLVVTLLPDRILSTVVSMKQEPAGVDAYKLDRELRSIVVGHGGIFIDVLPEFQKMLDPQLYYMPVDDHPYPSGHRVIADILADDLTENVAALTPKSQTAARSAQEK